MVLLMKFQTPKGTRDYAGEDAVKLQKLLDVIRSVFIKYGFSPLFTPAFEDFSLLSAKGGLGEDVKDDIYYFKDKSDRELGLRFEFTMSLVRFVTSNPQIPKPLKRYAIGRVWRYDNPQAMRYREFWQADIDIVGSDSMIADTECLAAICECLESLGFQDFFIRINSRKLVQSVLEQFVDPEQIKEVLRTIDKRDKIGADGVKAELEGKDIDKNDISKILKFLKISGSNTSIVKKIRKRYGDVKGLKEIEEILEYSKEFGIAKRLKFDLSVVRGLDYYTGPVFEVELGVGASCGGGGRYDNLVKDVGGAELSATGISLGVSRIFEVMKSGNMFDRLLNDVNVFVAYTEENLLPQSVKVARRIRKIDGVMCQTEMAERNLSKQLEYADAVKADYVIIVGKKELKENKYVFKDMKLKTEERMKLGDIVKKLKSAKKG
jgi:histidyl-tRNA synthetase